MTPKRFFDSAGGSFACTVLDDRAGIRHAKSCYTLAPEGQNVARLPAETFAAVQGKAEEGERRMAAGDFRGAFDLFVEAFQFLPEPREQWNAAGWLLVALGENAIRAGSFQTAEGPLTDAMWCPGTIGNPWVHLRCGQMRFELGQMDRAADELARAYMGGGREIFQGQDPKYFALVEQVLQPPPGMDRLP
jgi:tetratricopeptide (TPR) repeat protein